ncbi:aromatic ring-hydroxylating dioxygenase subunit alpha [Sphingomonas sp. RT2P30]|uniref:aromatic ring-hydroxylating oxygenase subunit alpha n=1 Tax=Parasphingomonas halimpatiens TaxID=3096162 RepID=UPI002FC8BC3A
MDATTTERIKAGMAYETARTAPPEGFPKLADIPSGRYIDPAFLQLEDERLWKRSWLYAGHVDQLPEPGSWFLNRNTGTPILIVRDLQGEVRAFYNSCRHRGGPLVKEEAGTSRGFVCGYHGWSYTLAGELTAIRDKRDFVEFDFACRSLISVRCERLGGWIFINEDPEAGPLIDSLGPIAGELAQFQIDDLMLVDSRGYDVACNVKVLLDAFLEVYHLKSIHQSTVNRFLDHRGTSITLWPGGHSRMTTPNRRPDWIDPGTKGMPEIPTVTEIPRDNNVSYNIYPNIVMPPAATGLPMLVFWPRSDRTMRIECHWFSPRVGKDDLSPLWETRVSNFERILYEDLQFAPQIQESVESPGFRGIPLNYQERRIYHWHEELDRRIGLDRVPEHLRVVPMLEDWMETE